MLGPVADKLADMGACVERVVYADDAVDEVAEQIARLDGVLVWVNPIQDGANRAQLDTLLREAGIRGTWVSTHPDVIRKMGTKEILYYTRTLGWGTDTDLFRSAQEFSERFPVRLARAGQLVVKQARGNGGNGVWSVAAPPSTHLDLALDTVVRVRHALTRDAPFEEITLAAFVERCDAYFAWSGSLISQPYQARLPDGMVRCYFVQDRVVGFCHQWPGGLLDPVAQTATTHPSRIPWEAPDTPQYQELRARAENEWLPGMQQLLGLATEALPVIWDADFLYGPTDADGQDTYVLCEINVSCVWPFPPEATNAIAQAAMARVQGPRLACA